MSRIKGRKITYTPKQTTEYEKLIRASYTAVSKIFFEKDRKKEEKMIFLGDIIMEVFLWKIKKVRCL